MKIEDLDRAISLAKEIRKTESLIEEIRSCTVIRLLTPRFDSVWSSDVESDKKQLAILNRAFKQDILSYYDAVLHKLKIELDQI